MKNSTVFWIVIILSILGYYDYKLYLHNLDHFYVINIFIWLLWEIIFGIIRINYHGAYGYSFKRDGWKIISITPLFFSYILIKYYVNEILDKI